MPDASEARLRAMARQYDRIMAIRSDEDWASELAYDLEAATMRLRGRDHARFQEIRGRSAPVEVS